MSYFKSIAFVFGATCFLAAFVTLSVYIAQPPWVPGWLQSDTNESPDKRNNDIEDFIVQEVNPENIRNYLRYLTTRPHLGGTEAEKQTALWVGDTWESQGMDEVHLVPYEVLLSYPEKDTPNLVRVLDESGEAAWTSQGWQKPLYAPEESSPEVPPNFNGYSAPGDVKGEVVYAHFGRQEDFKTLKDQGVDVEGKIVLARYGEIFRGNIVDNAEKLGAIGVILYPDPEQYASAGEDNVYPDTVFMPGTAAPSGSVYLGDGDPLTPFYPSVEHAYHIPESEAPLTKIPVQPICYDDAREIIGRMGGTVAPEEWQGGLNVTYKLGPGLTEPGWTLGLEVLTHSVRTTTYNVIGVIKGSVEPDRYVVVGNHRDAWVFGGADPSSGTAAMLELSRVLLKYRNETGWQPRRSIVVCSWGSEEYGLIGSTEWTEQFQKQLSGRAVAYLNIDIAITGNYSMRAISAPLLTDLVFQAATKVPNPDEDEVAAGRLTVYDTWALRMPDQDKPGRPRIVGVGSGSDFKGFQHNLGVPILDISYTHSPEMYAEPLYHTLYETFELMDELYDRGFKFFSAITTLWSILAVDVAESQLLPMSLMEYSDFISSAYDDIVVEIGPLVAERNLTLDHFGEAVEAFAVATQEFTDNLPFIDTDNPLAVRRANDQMMMVERAFIDPRGLPDRPHYNHVVMAPSISDTYSSSAFSGLTDILNGITELSPEEQERRWETFSQHLSAVTHFVHTSAKVMSDTLW